MSDLTLKKVAGWLKYQEEVYGKYHLPVISDINDAEQAVVTSGIAETPDPYGVLDMITSLDNLLQHCREAEILRTDLDGTNLVFGTGNPAADLMLIGEAPGEQEDRQGEPFVGKAGQLLNKILKAIRFEREQVYIANILKHRPPNNRDPHPEERQKSLPFLEKQIDLINPKLILCLGRISAHTLLETTAPMKDLRGRFHRYRDKYEILVTYHPAALLRNPNWKRDTWEDVQLLRKRYDELGGKP
ncbi:MAG: uracil-DNA glycosylase [Cyclonatronaceae bacterium]